MTDLEKFWNDQTRTRRRANSVTRILTALAIGALVITLTGLAVILPIPQNLIAKRLVGCSMQPTHHEGDLVIVDTDVSIKDLDYGDVIVFEADPQYGWKDNTSSICHRVFSIEDGYVLTHGDHNEYVDAQPIDDSTLIGRCVMHMPKMGWLVDPKVLLPIATAGLMFAMYGLVTNKTASDAQGQLVQVWPTYAEFCERRRQAALAGHAMAQ